MKGFTLLELLVVLLIAASAIALVLPQLSGARAGIVLKSSAREVAGALRAARGEAIARHREVSFVTAAEVSGSLDGVIRFFPDGSSSGGSIRLSAAGRSYVIEVDWLTGRVAILD